jgi:endonuclease/exonuclease/phosphatase family metal-dependent hydrolase
MPEAIKLISLNTEAGKHWERILPWVKKFQPDIICFQEVFEDDIEMLKQELGMDGIFAPLARITKPNRYELPPLGRWGMVVLTNLPFEDASYAYYKGSGDHIPEMVDGEPNSINRGLAMLRCDKDGLTYTVATTHFTWSTNGDTSEEQLHDFARLALLLEKVPEVILCGDFNAPRGRDVFNLLSERYTDNIPADVTSSLDEELHRVGYKQLMVDGLFTSPAYKAEDVEVVCGVSDHCGITARVRKVE